MKRAYVPRKFSASSQNLINISNAICAEYQAAGYDLTLRQLYYQFVSRGLIANKDSEYKRLGSVVNDARLAGLIDWDYIVDRTRHLRSLGHWDSPADVLTSAAASYRADMWADQKYRPEVWIEKDALVGVIERVCNRWDVPYFSCRGYTSQSEMWGAAQRIGGHLKEGKTPVILHFGDHDPSGIDMSRDIQDRLWQFLLVDYYIDVIYPRFPDKNDPGLSEMSSARGIVDEIKERQQVENALDFRRLALNMPQVDHYSPPPNPAKLTDARAQSYIAEYGPESWELDALEPQVIEALIEEEIMGLIDLTEWERKQAEVDADKTRLRDLAREWRVA